MKEFDDHFWVYNFTNKPANIEDLNLRIEENKKYNLLDKRSFNYTLEQLEKSITSGSLFKNRKSVVLMAEPPIDIVKPIPVSKMPLSSRCHFVVIPEEKVYDELIFSDEKLAEEFSNDYMWTPNKKE